MCSGLDTVSAIIRLDLVQPEIRQRLSDLFGRPLVLVKIRKRIVSVENGPRIKQPGAQLAIVLMVIKNRGKPQDNSPKLGSERHLSTDPGQPMQRPQRRNH